MSPVSAQRPNKEDCSSGSCSHFTHQRRLCNAMLQFLLLSFTNSPFWVFPKCTLHANAIVAHFRLFDIVGLVPFRLGVQFLQLTVSVLRYVLLLINFYGPKERGERNWYCQIHNVHTDYDTHPAHKHLSLTMLEFITVESRLSEVCWTKINLNNRKTSVEAKVVCKMKLL